MSSLIGVSPRGIRRTVLYTIFYYEVDPSQLAHLPSGTEFVTVYSPTRERGWRAIRFRAIGTQRKQFEEITTRFLEADEITYFENMLKALDQP